MRFQNRLISYQQACCVPITKGQDCLWLKCIEEMRLSLYMFYVCVTLREVQRLRALENKVRGDYFVLLQ
jgi:hypothetical protein